MKTLLKLVFSTHIFLYRISGGRIWGSMFGVPVLLLTTTGRKTGKARTVPLGYIRDEDTHVIVAAGNNPNAHPGWYFNLQSNPQVIIHVKSRVIQANASTADPDTRGRLWDKLLHDAPAYRRYEANRAKTIPLVILRPTE